MGVVFVKGEKMKQIVSEELVRKGPEKGYVRVVYSDGSYSYEWRSENAAMIISAAEKRAGIRRGKRGTRRVVNPDQWV